MNYLGVIFVSLILISCQTNTIKSSCELEYDFEVKTIEDVTEREFNREKFKEDILYIIIASNFNQRDVNIYRNGELFEELTDMKTDPIDGTSIELEMKKEGLNDIAFQIDNGNLIFVDFCDQPSNFITVFFNNNKAVVNKMNYPPSFE